MSFRKLIIFSIAGCVAGEATISIGTSTPYLGINVVLANVALIKRATGRMKARRERSLFVARTFSVAKQSRSANSF